MELLVSTPARADARCEACGELLELEMEHDAGLCADCQAEAALAKEEGVA